MRNLCVVVLLTSNKPKLDWMSVKHILFLTLGRSFFSLFDGNDLVGLIYFPAVVVFV